MSKRLQELHNPGRCLSDITDEESDGSSSDWVFWFKCGKAGERVIFDEAAFGRHFLNPDSHNRRNDPAGIKERRIIKDFIGVEQAELQKQ